MNLFWKLSVANNVLPCDYEDGHNTLVSDQFFRKLLSFYWHNIIGVIGSYYRHVLHICTYLHTYGINITKESIIVLYSTFKLYINIQICNHIIFVSKIYWGSMKPTHVRKYFIVSVVFTYIIIYSQIFTIIQLKVRT